jgi:signal transduction histidine kinase/DNA-binding NarL/FixJ family response regulator
MSENTRYRSVPAGLLLLLGLAGPFLFSDCARGGAGTPPEARNGVLDLAGWDFEKDGPVDLSGEWKFKWAESDPEFGRPDTDDSDWAVFRVPDSWNHVTGTADGFGWFRLRIRNAGPEKARLGLYLKHMVTAGRMFVDGREVMRDGVPGVSRDTTTAGGLPQVVPLPAGTGGDFIVAWRISNFHNWNGGPRYQPIIGTLRDLSFGLWLRDLRDVFLTGLILMMGTYGFILWLMRSSDRASLIFAALCLANALRIFFLGGFLQRLIPDADIFDLRMRLESIVTLSAAALYGNFFALLFPLDFHKTIMRLWNWLAVGVGVFFLAVPAWITTRFTLAFDLSMALLFLWLLFSMIRAVRNKREGAKTVAFGLALLGLTLVIDIFNNSLPSLQNADLFGIGTVAVIVCYSAVLSSRSARAHRLSETLSANLRAEVDRQTEKITEQNRELEKLVRERTDSFVNFNHEIKTPLTLMGNYLERARQAHANDADLEIVRQNLDKLRRDVTNSLDLEKLVRNQVFYRHDQALALDAVAREKVALFAPLAGAKHITLRFSDGADAAYVRVDPFALDRILNNLLDNAVRYTPSGGAVEVSAARQPGGRVALAVADTGIGIPEAQLRFIFEPYYQVRHKKSNLQGMGMGLSIVKRIMNDLGGEIRVESREREGSRFTLVFPACSPPVAAGRADGGDRRPTLSKPLPPAEVRFRPETYDGNKDTLLVVEDNPTMLAFLQESLCGGYNVYYARSGREAALKLESMPDPELILSDIMMDDMDGYEFLDLVVRSPDYRSIPLVFVTARALPGDAVEGLSRGAVDVIRKPFSLEELKAKIAAIVRQRKVERETAIREAREELSRRPGKGFGPEELARFREENYRRFRITRRERQIIQLLTAGLEYKEISARLSLSFNTIKPYIRDIYKKCGINNRTELIGIFHIDPTGSS